MQKQQHGCPAQQQEAEKEDNANGNDDGVRHGAGIGADRRASN